VLKSIFLKAAKQRWQEQQQREQAKKEQELFSSMFVTLKNTV